MKKTLLFIMVLCCALTLTVSLACARPGGNRGMVQLSPAQQQQRLENRLEKMALTLDLTAEQREEIGAVMREQQQHQQQLKTNMAAGRDKLRQLRRQQPFDAAAFKAQGYEMVDMKADMLQQRAETRSKVDALLTPQQREKRDKLRALHQQRKQSRKGGCAQTAR